MCVTQRLGEPALHLGVLLERNNRHGACPAAKSSMGTSAMLRRSPDTAVLSRLHLQPAALQSQCVFMLCSMIFCWPSAGTSYRYDTTLTT